MIVSPSLLASTVLALYWSVRSHKGCQSIVIDGICELGVGRPLQPVARPSSHSLQSSTSPECLRIPIPLGNKLGLGRSCHPYPGHGQMTVRALD